jgi:hypothetical protein
MIDNQIPNRSDFISNEEWLDARTLYWKRELNTALAELTELREYKVTSVNVIREMFLENESLRAELADAYAVAHRLALELECLILDTKDLPIQSKWWETSMAALGDWHEMWNKEQPHVSAFGKD